MPFWMPPSQALVQKDLKYFNWTAHNYEQVFNMTDDPFEERDLRWSTSTETLKQIRNRFNVMKELSQSGAKV